MTYLELLRVSSQVRRPKMDVTGSEENDEGDVVVM